MSDSPADRADAPADVEEAPADGSKKRSRLSSALRIGGILIALLAVALLVRTLVDEWPKIRHSVEHADAWWLVVAAVLSAAAMTGLGLLWWRCLDVFGDRVPMASAVGWYFGGELGKYVPGGVWPVLGRGELALRAGVNRTTAYVTTLISYAAMCVAAAVACALLAPFIATAGGGLGWGWAMLAFIPLGAAVVHPAVLGHALELGRKLTRGRVDPTPPTWGRMLELIAWSIPTWLLVGLASASVTEALGYDQHPARVAFAAIAAWILGFLAVPVPAGAGLRELVFVGLSGLSTPEAVAVAAISRVLFIVVDAAGGIIGLWHSRRTARRRAGPAPAPLGDPAIAGGRESI